MVKTEGMGVKMTKATIQEIEEYLEHKVKEPLDDLVTNFIYRSLLNFIQKEDFRKKENERIASGEP